MNDLIFRHSQSHIDALVYGGREVGWWHLAGFYGDLDTNKKPKSWRKLRYLSRTTELPWLVIGDFNEIISVYEKE